jgi:hypothetical protein
MKPRPAVALRRPASGGAPERHHPAPGHRAVGRKQATGGLTEAFQRPGLADPVRAGRQRQDRPLSGGQPIRRRLDLGIGEDVGRRRVVLQSQQSGSLDHLVDRLRCATGDGALPGPEEPREA